MTRFGVEMIGASAEAIATAEDRERFKQAMTEIGLAVPESGFAYTLDEAIDVADKDRFPADRPPFYILGGAAPGSPMDPRPRALAAAGLAASPISEILIERSIAGWKEYELEVMRDRADNCVVVCSIENFDPMGVHTGDSITVAPAQTLSDVEYQTSATPPSPASAASGSRPVAPTSSSPSTRRRRQVVIEMNPRVSRSQRAGLEGHRVPDRQDRRPTGRRIHPGRDRQRHHR